MLNGIKYVVDQAKYVAINLDKLQEYCSTFPTEDFQINLEPPFPHERMSDEQELAMVIVFNAVNYSYWGKPKWSVDINGKYLGGSWSMDACLRRAITEGKPILNPTYLSKLTLDEVKHILRANVEIPLIEERCKALVEVGINTVKLFAGSFVNLIKACDKDVVKLANLLVQTYPSFDDSFLYKGRKIRFLKRAQLAASEIHHKFDGKGFGEFTNMNELTAFADYKIPQILRKLGILEYTHELSEKVDSQIELAAGCEEEIEIRASMVWAVELMRKEISKRRDISSANIDTYLWLESQKKDPTNKPYHRTRTTAY